MQNVKERDHLEDLGTDGREKQGGNVWKDWIYQDQDRNQWKVFVKMVMNLQVLYLMDS